jgi:hypothetical protein
MGTVLYIHRMSKLIDEMVKELGLTLTLSDETSGIKLTDHLENMKQMALNLGVAMHHEAQPTGKIIVVFTPR